MHIGIIGTGEVARSIAKGLAEAGHSVMLGSMSPEDKELVAWKKKVSKKIELGNTTEAASYAETAVLAVAWHAAEDILALIRPELAGKIVIDVTNPLVFYDDAPPSLSVGHNISGGEIVQHSLPDSHVVKTLNYVNHAHIDHPHFKEGKPVMFMCGNNQSAKIHTQDILTELGWEDVVDIGEIEKSRLLEPLSLLWIEYGVARDTWNHAVSILQH